MKIIPWDDLVFWKRNRSYGAYVLRKEYPSALAASFVFMLVVMTVVLTTSPFLFKIIKNIAAGDRAVKKLVLNIIPPKDEPKTQPARTEAPVVRRTRVVVPRTTAVQQSTEAVTPVVESPDASANVSDNLIAIEQPMLVTTPPIVALDDPDKVWNYVEQSPEFPGGVSKLMKFIGSNMRYPASGRRMGIEGSVFISFVVDSDGTIDNVQAVKGITDDFDKEAMRVVKKMPRWNPGKRNGVPVKVRFVLPVKFKLSDS